MSWSEAISVAGIIGTVSLLILNLKVASEVNLMKVEMANLRTEMAREAAAHYGQVMNNLASMVESITKTFSNREAADAKHQANLDRLGGIERQIGELNQRVADIS